MRSGDEVAMRGKESDAFYKERSESLASQVGGEIVERDGALFLVSEGKQLTLAAGGTPERKWFSAWNALSHEVRKLGLDRRKTPRM